MADLRVVDVEQLEADLMSIAEVIREITGTEDMLQFPSDFVNALYNIEVWESGEY